MRILSMAQICCFILGIWWHPAQTFNHYAPNIDLAKSDYLAFKNDRSDQKDEPYTFPKFDEYGDLPFPKEKKRLDYFAQELTSVPDELGYIIEYDSKRHNRKSLARANRAKDYLVRVKGIDSKRIRVVNGGYRKEFKIELRLGPAPLK